jgi:methylenetetrahydrofolate reductase (NADPH)
MKHREDKILHVSSAVDFFMLKISDRLKKKQPVFSFEFFPPKSDDGERLLMQTIEELKPLEPDFVSVTYGAGGSTREKTREWVRSIQDRFSIPAMAHLTCVGSGREDIFSILKDLHADGIRNIMALRGDPPRGETSFVARPDGFRYANELVSFIRQTEFDFCVGAAAYPEVHAEAPSEAEDLKNLKRKVDSGVDFLVTQLFFDNEKYFSFMDKVRAIGIEVPVIPGIMPVTAFKQIERFTAMAGCAIPGSLIQALADAQQDSEALLRISLDYTLRQCEELLARGAPGIHFYTLNQSRATAIILDRLRVSVERR